MRIEASEMRTGHRQRDRGRGVTSALHLCEGRALAAKLRSIRLIANPWSIPKLKNRPLGLRLSAAAAPPAQSLPAAPFDLALVPSDALVQPGRKKAAAACQTAPSQRRRRRRAPKQRLQTMAALGPSWPDTPAPPHHVRTATFVNLAAVLERCDEQASPGGWGGCRSLALKSPVAPGPGACNNLWAMPTFRPFSWPAIQMLPAVYSFIGASWSATPTQLGYITLCRALVQALSSPVGGIAGAPLVVACPPSLVVAAVSFCTAATIDARMCAQQPCAIMSHRLSYFIPSPGHLLHRGRVIGAGCLLWAACTATFAACGSLAAGAAVWAVNGLGLALVLPNTQVRGACQLKSWNHSAAQ